MAQDLTALFRLRPSAGSSGSDGRRNGTMPPRAGLWDWLRSWAGRVFHHLRDGFAEEFDQGRAVLWLPALMCLGEIAYFTAPSEPNDTTSLISGLALWAIGLIAWIKGRAHVLWLAVGFIALGFALAALNTQGHRAAPRLSHPITAPLTGRIIQIDTRLTGARLNMEVHVLGTLAQEERPREVMVSIGDSEVQLAPGQEVTMLARLRPPSQPSVPGGYDSAFLSYFRNIGGVGFALGRLSLIAPPEAEPSSWLGQVGEWFDQGLATLRFNTTAQISHTLEGDSAAIAAALMVGQRGGISEGTNNAMRISGLFHVMSVSGLHMSLVAAAVYFVVRRLGAAIPVIALRWPLKSIAAASAILITYVYLRLEGTDIPATRSAIVVIAVTFGVLMNRPHLPMRMVAVSAMIVFVIWPYAILDPGTQMSYAAVIALVAAFQHWSKAFVSRATGYGPRALLHRLGMIVLAGSATSLVAGLASGPIALGTFDQISPLNIISNELSSPLEDFIIMPFGMMAAVLMPFGFEYLPLKIMGAGIDGMIFIAKTIADITPNNGIVGQPPLWPVVLMLAAGLWMCLWRGWVLWLGAPFVALALWSLATFHPPDLAIAADGTVIAIAGSPPTLLGKGDRFSNLSMIQALGSGLSAKDPALKQGQSCDADACISDVPATETSPPLRVALVKTPQGLLAECLDADVIVTAWPAPDWCKSLAHEAAPAKESSPHAPLVIDSEALNLYGALTLRRTATGITILASNFGQSRRPWQTEFRALPPRKPTRQTEATDETADDANPVEVD